MLYFPTIIAAFGKDNHVIGNHGRLPWSLPEEYEHFRRTIAGGVMVMGRVSYDIFGDDLTTFCDIVVSTTLTQPPVGKRPVQLASGLTEAVRLAGVYDRPIFIGGGRRIYQEAIDGGLANSMILSFIHAHYDGDTAFPDFDLEQWKVMTREPHGEFTVVRYRRIER